MLKEIEKAVNRALNDFKVKFTSDNESVQEQNVLVTLIAVEVLKEVTTDAQAAARKPNRKTPTPEGEN